MPHRHDDYSQQRTIAQLRPGEQATVVANLWEVRERKISMKRQMVQAVISDGTGTLQAQWWNKYVRNQLKPGATMRFSGKVGLFLGHKTLESPQFEDVDEDEREWVGGVGECPCCQESHLGGSSSPALHGAARVGLDARHVV